MAPQNKRFFVSNESDNKLDHIHGTKVQEEKPRKFYLRRNFNVSAQAETGECSVRCTVTSLICK